MAEKLDLTEKLGILGLGCAWQCQAALLLATWPLMGGFTCPSTSQPPATSASQNRETWPSPLTIPVSAGGTHSFLPCSKGGVEGLTFSPDFPHTDIWTWPKAVVWILGWLHNGALLVGIRVLC